MHPLLAPVLALALLAPSTQVLLANGSFEPAGDPPRPVAVAPAGVIPGWTAAGTGVTWVTAAARGFEAPSGRRVVAFGGGGTLRQDVATEPGRTYRVAFWLGGGACEGDDGTAALHVSVARSHATCQLRNREPEVLWQARTVVFRALARTTTLEFRGAHRGGGHTAYLDGVAIAECDGGAEPQAGGPSPELDLTGR
jgi:hypothetical protein